MRTLLFSAVLSLGFSAIAGVCVSQNVNALMAKEVIKTLFHSIDIVELNKNAGPVCTSMKQK